MVSFTQQTVGSGAAGETFWGPSAGGLFFCRNGLPGHALHHFQPPAPPVSGPTWAGPFLAAAGYFKMSGSFDSIVPVHACSMNLTKVAVVGLGTVGSGVVRLLTEQADRIGRRAGTSLRLERVVVRDPLKPRLYGVPASLLTTDLARITADPEIKIVAQLIGGIEPARQIMLELLDNGKHVVTANKALLAEHGPELFARARGAGCSIAFEASVAGGIPIVTNLSQCLAANEIHSLHGILNGTSNFILSEMDSRGAEYADALREAQGRGYAESDPAMDVDGTDAAQKLAILAHLAFGVRVGWSDIARVGIECVAADDIRYAHELGYRIKLLAVARKVAARLEVHVGPTLVRVDSPLAQVGGAFNAIHVVGDAVGPVFFQGLGAGQMPTASAVVADMIDTATGRLPITFQRLGLWSDRERAVEVADMAEVRGRFYVRHHAADRAGVMAAIAGILGRHGISIASVIQHEEDGTSRADVPLAIITHETSERSVNDACSEIARLPSVHSSGVRMKIWE